MQDDDGLGGGVLEILDHAVKVEPAGSLKGGKENTVILLQYKTELQKLVVKCTLKRAKPDLPGPSTGTCCRR